MKSHKGVLHLLYLAFPLAKPKAKDRGGGRACRVPPFAPHYPFALPFFLLPTPSPLPLTGLQASRRRASFLLPTLRGAKPKAEGGGGGGKAKGKSRGGGTVRVIRGGVEGCHPLITMVGYNKQIKNLATVICNLMSAIP